MKLCGKCKELKSLECFSKRTVNGKIGYQSYCRKCNSEWCRKEYYEGDRKKRNVNFKIKRRAVLRKIIDNFKISKGCSACGYNKNKYALDLHHISDKIECVNKMINLVVSVEKLEREIMKCIVLCSNCHRELHNPLGNK